jgi:hypothetical protein
MARFGVRSGSVAFVRSDLRHGSEPDGDPVLVVEAA